MRTVTHCARLTVPFDTEVHAVLAHYVELEKILGNGAPPEEREEEADRYMAGVLSIAGLRVYEAVLTMVAAARGIPPKGAPR